MKPNATDYATLDLGLELGVIFLAHGLLKFFVFSMPGTAGFSSQSDSPDGWPIPLRQWKCSPAWHSSPVFRPVGWRSLAYQYFWAP